jgi:ankyrin repeat protein
VKSFLPTRQLPEHPNLEQLRRQAKELLDRFRSGDTDATAEISRFYSDADRTIFALHDAQLVLARSYGFRSWPKLKAFVDGVTISRLIGAVRTGNVEQVRAILRLRSELVNRDAPSSHGHTALHYAVLDRKPEMVRVLMQSGADPRTTTAGIYFVREAATPLAIALERGYDDIAAIIREEELHREPGRPATGTVPVALRSAFETGDEDRLIDLLQQKPEMVDFRLPPNRWALLHAASALLLPRTAAWLLDHGANVNEPAKDGTRPLDVAGRRSNTNARSEKLRAVADLLRNRGATLTPRSAVILGDGGFLRQTAAEEDLISPQDADGWLLGLAVDYDRPDILKLLLQLGLDPDARVRVEDDDRVNFSWGMPLYQCVRAGKHEMAVVLLRHGADPNGQVYAGGTPLSEAYGQRDEKMIALLEQYGGKTNASMAGLYRRPDIAKRLLDEFGDTGMPDDGFAAGPVANQLLAAAARGGDAEIMRMAIERVQIPDGDRRWNELLERPLFFWNHWTGPWCHHEWDRSTYLACFKMLLEKCGPQNAPLNGGATILHQIVVMGDHVRSEERIAFATAALDAGARLDLRDDLLKSTPLGWACRWGRDDLVRLFLERGADPVEADAESWASPRAWAEKKGHRDIVALLDRLKR